MMRINDSLAKFLDALVASLKGSSWSPRANAPQADLQWWSCALSVDPACRFMAGAPEDVWNGLAALTNDGFAQFAAAVQEAAAAQFGSEVVCEGMEQSDSPEDGDWTAARAPSSLRLLEQRQRPPNRFRRRLGPIRPTSS
jgi:hypothetical protein